MWELGIFIVYIACSFFKKIIIFALGANFYKNRLCSKPTLFFDYNKNLHLQGHIWPSIRKGELCFFFVVVVVFYHMQDHHRDLREPLELLESFQFLLWHIPFETKKGVIAMDQRVVI